MANHDPWGIYRAVVAGPFLYLIPLGSLMIIGMIASVFRKLGSLANRTRDAASRLQRNSALPLIWGFAALLLLLAIAAIFINHAPFRLIGIASLLVFLALMGMGLGVAALAQGRASLQAFNAPAEDLRAAQIGLWTLFLAEFVPIAGWLAVALSIFAGAGAFLDVLFRRETAAPETAAE